MQKEEIHLWDIQRIIFGEVPATFIIESILRLLIVYIILIMSMRLMGKRMATEMNVIELAALVSLAAAIGMAIGNPDRGILPAIIIAAVVILIQQILAFAVASYKKFEKVAIGNIHIMVEDSKLNLKNMQKTRVSRERIFAQLRSEGIKHLGQVKRLYFEASGDFTLIRNEQPAPGLAVIPLIDQNLLNAQNRENSGTKVCTECGFLREKAEFATECDECGNHNFTEPISPSNHSSVTSTKSHPSAVFLK